MGPPTAFERVMLRLGLRVWKCRDCTERPGRCPCLLDRTACPLVHVWRWQRAP